MEYLKNASAKQTERWCIVQQKQKQKRMIYHPLYEYWIDDPRPIDWKNGQITQKSKTIQHNGYAEKRQVLSSKKQN